MIPAVCLPHYDKAEGVTCCRTSQSQLAEKQSKRKMAFSPVFDLVHLWRALAVFRDPGHFPQEKLRQRTPLGIMFRVSSLCALTKLAPGLLQT
jgi:hypothetical protein